MRWTVLLLVLAACSKPAKPLTSIPYTNDFEKPLGPEWTSTSPTWGVSNGQLVDTGAKNQPLWLSASLPKDVRISFKATPQTPDVDFKFELFGDGERHESGYSVMFGAWHNTKSEIARLGEHAPQRTPVEEAQLRAAVADNALRAETVNGNRRDCVRQDGQLAADHTYHVRFERRGNDIKVFLDDEEYMRYFDPSPLWGPGRDRFAFSNWATRVSFDDLKIEAL